MKRERLRSAIVAPDYVSLGGTVDLASLESRLKPEGGLQQEDVDGNESGSDEDRRMTFVGGRGNGRSAPAEPQVLFCWNRAGSDKARCYCRMS